MVTDFNTLKKMNFCPREDKNMHFHEKVYKWLDGVFLPSIALVPNAAEMGFTCKTKYAYPVTSSETASVYSMAGKEQHDLRTLTKGALELYRNEAEKPYSLIQSSRQTPSWQHHVKGFTPEAAWGASGYPQAHIPPLSHPAVEPIGTPPAWASFCQDSAYPQQSFPREHNKLSLNRPEASFMNTSVGRTGYATYGRAVDANNANPQTHGDATRGNVTSVLDRYLDTPAYVSSRLTNVSPGYHTAFQKSYNWSAAFPSPPCYHHHHQQQLQQECEEASYVPQQLLPKVGADSSYIVVPDAGLISQETPTPMVGQDDAQTPIEPPYVDRRAYYSVELDGTIRLKQ